MCRKPTSGVGFRRAPATGNRLPRSVFMLAVLVSLALSAQSNDALLRRSDVGGFVPTTFRARLTMRQANESATSEVELWRSGPDRTLVRFLDPKERGKYLLRLGADLWFLAPGTKNPVRLSPTHRIYGAATLDVLFGLRLSDDYRITAATPQPDPAGALVVFDLQASSDRQQFASVRYVVRTTTDRPVSALYRLRSGREATLIEFFDWTGGERNQRYARRIHVRDQLRKGALTRIEATEFEERAVPEGLFDLIDGTARKALEKSGAH
jgi:hypothetical protein